MPHVLALSRLQSIWSFLSITTHMLLIMALLKMHNADRFDIPASIAELEFIEVSLAQELPQQPNEAQQPDDEPQNKLDAAPQNTTTPTAPKDAITIKVRDKNLLRHKAIRKPQITHIKRDNSYEEKLSRYFYQYIGNISYNGSNQIKIWLKLDANGYIQDHGFIATQLNNNLKEQLENALKKANPMPKPEKLQQGEVITYILPVLLD